MDDLAALRKYIEAKRLTHRDVLEIRDRLAVPGSVMRRIAKDFGVNARLIREIRLNRIWRHAHRNDKKETAS